MSHDTALIMRQQEKEIKRSHEGRRRMKRLGNYGMIAMFLLGLAIGLAF